ncbi:hypothetical protein COL516b_006973 [Colletotrichum fioriniae]|nr:uncharacterized protein COL516b_006973 [Colletotrichum fioriniae]KAJ0302926.1 hypothetical protein COL516b_006973 [Colletotrichum fioriniae]
MASNPEPAQPPPQTQSHPRPPPPPDFNLTYPPSLEPYNVPATTWLTTNSKSWDGLATGALVFSPTTNKILLLQRAAHDSMPLRWETPGGAADPEDTSLFAACARELWEEAGLEAVAIVTVKGDDDRGKGVEERVRIDPEEHCDFVWASEEEVRRERVGEREIPITNGQMARLILDGFRRRREEEV